MMSNTGEIREMRLVTLLNNSLFWLNAKRWFRIEFTELL